MLDKADNEGQGGQDPQGGIGKTLPGRYPCGRASLHLAHGSPPDRQPHAPWP